MVVGGRRGPRHQGGTRAKDILNQVKSSQTSRPPYPEGAQVRLEHGFGGRLQNDLYRLFCVVLDR